MDKMSGRDRAIAFVTTAVAFAGLGGCATMNSDECLTSDWTSIGYEDGVKGYTADRIGEHRKACAKHGVTPDLVDYQDGRSKGLLEYCQPSNGFRIGSNGGSYNSVCNAHFEGDFLDAFNMGSNLYLLHSNVSRADAAIYSKEHEHAGIDDEVHVVESRLISSGSTTEERVTLLLDLKNLSEQKGRLEAEIKDLYEHRAFSLAELERYRQTVSDLGF
jgi:hypothetical protein